QIQIHGGGGAGGGDGGVGRQVNGVRNRVSARGAGGRGAETAAGKMEDARAIADRAVAVHFKSTGGDGGVAGIGINGAQAQEAVAGLGESASGHVLADDAVDGDPVAARDGVDGDG